MSTATYTPPQWRGPATISITVPPQSNTITVGAPASLTLTPGGGTNATSLTGSAYTVYVFDAVLELEHAQELQVTTHPVQTGADINSHAYLMPAELMMSIGMSDAMAAYQGTNVQGVQATAFSGGSTKSVSAYQTMLALQAQRSLLTITTRLRTYANMLITRITPREDYRTITGLRMRVEFRQILTGTINTTKLTPRPDATQSSGSGQAQPGVVPSATQQQYGTPSTATTKPSYTTPTVDAPTQNLLNYLRSGQTVNSPGAGTYSSSVLSYLSNLPVPQ